MQRAARTQLKIAFIFSFFFLFYEGISQPRYLIPYREGNLWGYADTNLNIIVSPQYDEAGMFLSGYGRIFKNKLQGVVNAKGEEVIKPIYDELRDCCFENTIAVKDNRLGVVRVRDGRTLIPLNYEYVRSLDGVRYYILKIIGGNQGVFDLKTEKFILPANYEEIRVDHLREDISFLIATRPNDTVSFSISERKGFQRLPGNQRRPIPADAVTHSYIPPEVEMLETDGDGLVTTTYSWPVIRGGQQGWLHTVSKGGVETVDSIPAIYDTIYRVTGFDSLFIVSKNGAAGIISLKNKVFMPLQYEEVIAVDSSVNHGIYIVKQSGKYGLATFNKLLLPCDYDRISWVDYDIRAFILSLNSKTGAYLYDSMRKLYHVLIPAEYDIVWGIHFIQSADFDRRHSYNWNYTGVKFLVSVTKDGKRGFIDLMGKRFFKD